MMQAPDFGNLDDPAELRWLDWPSVGCIFVEREVSSHPVIVRDVAGQGDAELGEPGEAEVGAAPRAGLGGQRQPGPPGEQPLEGCARLLTGQGGPEAVVDAVTVRTF